MLTSGGVRGGNKGVKIMKAIEKGDLQFRDIWRLTDIRPEDLEEELEVLRHLGFAEVVTRQDGIRSSTGRSDPRPGMPARARMRNATFKLTEKGKRTASFFD